MKLQEKIKCLGRLGRWIKSNPPELQEIVTKTYLHNKWFTEDNIFKALSGITEEFLAVEKLDQWIAEYPDLIEPKSPKHVGLILAGNIPVVGFHDWLCVLISGHIPVIKLSEKDQFLLPLFDQYLQDIGFDTKTCFVDRLTGIEAVIATGSNNTSRYFESYFGKYPNIIRKNRNAIGLLSGKETEEELANLGKDIFSYFGLGCRSVSKIYVPEDYDFQKMLGAFKSFDDIVFHNKYKNNFDYNYTLIILNGIKHYSNGSILIVEDKSFTSRIATLHFETYNDLDTLAKDLNNRADEIQCICSNMKIKGLETISFGKAQQPELADYADGVDSLEFLMHL